ncbi:hypothetical protein B0H17DRAFT_1023714 [Mycena rosella]|uniref:Uncharacterized protein n=1 Tax=Mycena rosella TaxID=1033263 RepID=A0AAD7BY54_MYCRO|nr:hypothetical protein B0H17DRAFT_1023714 [Mycena rosella]
MEGVVSKAARAETKAEKEEILKKNGLHGIKHFLWDFRFSDPYAAYSYDTLHSDDLGKWGHHLWTLLLQVLEENDGQTFYDILKVRAQYFVARVSKEYGKNFDFFKQHTTSHLVQDIRSKGTTNHGSTRPGEGFQQEAAEAYNQTNFKNVASQMNRIDETQEAIARIRMAIDQHDQQCEEGDVDSTPKFSRVTSASWRFGAAGRIVNSNAFGVLKSAGCTVQNFDLMLRNFIAEHFPDDRVSYEQRIQIQPCKCAHLTYQSFEDWRGLEDIVRCNPSFHGSERYDSVLFNSDSPGMSFARISALLRCTLESKRQFDVALVHEFRQNKWKPRTAWAGCQVHEEAKEYSLLLMDYVIRGALLTRAPVVGKGNLHFLVDTVDPDMFLRADQY